MKIPATNSQKNGATEAPWPLVPKIARAEFEQSVAVAQLAVKLWENKIVKVQAPLEKDKIRDEGPKKFLIEAWELIERAREHVLRAQTDAEYLAAHSGSHEAAENVTGRILSESRIAFEKLCNKKETYTEIELHDADTKTIIKIEWKVYRSERAFNDLFWDYWNDIGEKWRNLTTRKDHGMLKTGTIKPDGTPQRVQMYSDDERQALAALAGNEDKWKERGQQVLASWKRNGVPPNDVLALAKFRREHDNRAANLKPKQQTKRRLQAVKHRKH